MSFLPIITPLKWMILPRPCTVHNRQLATGVEMAPLLTSKSLLEPHYGECDSLMITASLWAIMGIETSASCSWDSHRAMKGTVCSIYSLLDHQIKGGFVRFGLFFNDTIRKLWERIMKRRRRPCLANRDFLAFLILYLNALSAVDAFHII